MVRISLTILLALCSLSYADPKRDLVKAGRVRDGVVAVVQELRSLDPDNSMLIDSTIKPLRRIEFWAGGLMRSPNIAAMLNGLDPQANPIDAIISLHFHRAYNEYSNSGVAKKSELDLFHEAEALISSTTHNLVKACALAFICTPEWGDGWDILSESDKTGIANGSLTLNSQLSPNFAHVEYVINGLSAFGELCEGTDTFINANREFWRAVAGPGFRNIVGVERLRHWPIYEGGACGRLYASDPVYLLILSAVEDARTHGIQVYRDYDWKYWNTSGDLVSIDSSVFDPNWGLPEIPESTLNVISAGVESTDAKVRDWTIRSFRKVLSFGSRKAIPARLMSGMQAVAQRSDSTDDVKIANVYLFEAATRSGDAASADVYRGRLSSEDGSVHINFEDYSIRLLDEQAMEFVKEGKKAEAIAIWESIKSEYPNTRLEARCQEHIDHLQRRPR